MGARRRLGLVVAMGVIKLFTRAGGSQALTYVSFLRFAFPPYLLYGYDIRASRCALEQNCRQQKLALLR